jgi:SAM-dependent methyltransferase
VRQDTRAPFEQALGRAREAAFAPGDYVGQESFMRAPEIRALARRAGIGPGVSVLDLCCGVAGPGRFVTRELGCVYLGIDASASAIQIATARARGLPCRFEAAAVPPLPAGSFDVVLLLETMLAFRDKGALVRGVAGALAPGGRFAFTLEEGRPLTDDERTRMPDGDTVWLTPLDDLRELLARAGLTVTWQEDCTRSHREAAGSLLEAYAADAPAVAAAIGRHALDDLLTAHALWFEWLSAGRARKFALVARAGSDPERRL